MASQPFYRGLTWTSCVYRSVSSRLIFQRNSLHESFRDLSGLQLTGNTFCKMPSLWMLSHWRLSKRETNNLGFLQLFGFYVGLPDWWIIKRRTPKESGWEMFCHCAWQRLCVKKNENRFELYFSSPKVCRLRVKAADRYASRWWKQNSILGDGGDGPLTRFRWRHLCSWREHFKVSREEVKQTEFFILTLERLL